MGKKRLIIIKSNALDRDIRVPKEIAALNKDFSIIFLGWNRDYPKNIPTSNNEEITQKLINFKAPYGKSIIFYLPIWWIYLFWWLLLNKWDIAHVINFNSAIPVILVSKIKNKKVVYEILDINEDASYIPETIRICLMKIDKFFLSLSDGVILADNAQIEAFDGIQNQNIVSIYDSPPDMFDPIKSKSDSKFILFFAGVLYKDRYLNFDKIIEAIQQIDNIKLVIAGYGDLVPEIQEWEKKMPDKLEYIGKISYIEVMDNILRSDLLFVLRDSSIPSNKYICGSTLLNAMMCGKPVLVNKGTSTAYKVSEENCGLVVDANQIEEIKNAIMSLKNNPDLLKLLGSNARKAYEIKYSWKIMERKLQELYKNYE